MKNIVSIIDCDMKQDHANYLFNESIFYQTEDQLKSIPGMFMQLARDKERFVPPWRKELEQLCTVPMDLDQVKPFENDKVQLNFLINSNGGEGIIFEYYKNLINHVKSNRGNVSLYVSDKAYSAAELLSREADQINYLDDSKFLWHLPKTDLQNPFSDEASHKYMVRKHLGKYLNQTMNYLSRNRTSNSYNLDQFEEIMSENGDLILNGRQIDNLFNLGNSSNSINEMKNKFCSDTGLTLKDNHPVSAFFNDYANSSKGFELRLV